MGSAIAGLLGGSRRNQGTSAGRRENSDESRSAMISSPGREEHSSFPRRWMTPARRELKQRQRAGRYTPYGDRNQMRGFRCPHSSPRPSGARHPRERLKASRNRQRDDNPNRSTCGMSRKNHPNHVPPQGVTGGRGGANAARPPRGSEDNQVREAEWAFSLVRSFRRGQNPD